MCFHEFKNPINWLINIQVMVLNSKIHQYTILTMLRFIDLLKYIFLKYPYKNRCNMLCYPKI
ncbi:hypothetical protein A1OE_427 [Candidatus Endolissoclinum faulkneri L2]|uniref:Uncharacterized protein n=1 Tax=Candidatus Endolissoclinum faulkneri L2 TaxID=1193729 RepID=K7YG91_9PROT|nr:hypothetical protein A1OE_427 [Candidatus Endolissoclinum faulkneri L2]